MARGPMSAGKAEYYIDYLKHGEEALGQWLGSGAEALELESKVEPDAFRRLLHGFLEDGAKLVQNAGTKDHRAGWEGVFSAPKSVSVLWGVCGDERIRKEIETAQSIAVQKAVAHLEDVAGVTRTGKGGEHRERAGLVVAAFQHSTSRAQDPDLHTHIVVANVAVRQNGRTSALESYGMYEHKINAGSIYRAELAAQLEQRLGVEIRRERSWFEIEGVPRELCQELSKRGSEIQEELRRRGESGPRAADIAALETRTKKVAVPRSELYEQWGAVAERHAFTPEVVKTILFRPKPERSIDAEAKAALREALDVMTRSKTYFTDRELLKEVAQAAQNRGIGADAVIKEVATYKKGETFALTPDALMPLGKREGERLYTTAGIWELEKDLTNIVRRSRQNLSHELTGATVRSVLLEQKLSATLPLSNIHELNPEQKAALRHVTRESGAISVVAGMAGTGKTALMTAVRQAYHKEGYDVLGVAVAGKAARGLEMGSGIKSRTVASFIASLERWEQTEQQKDATWKYKAIAAWKHATWEIDGKTARKLSGEYYKPTSEWKHEFLYATHRISKGHKEVLNAKLREQEGKAPPRFQLHERSVIVIDEASMVTTKNLHRILSAVEKYGAKVVLVGDAKQLTAIGPGAPLSHVTKLVGCAELKEIKRQRGPDREWQIPAIHLFSEGRAAEAIREYEKRGLVTITERKHEARQALIEKWKEAGVSNPRDNLIFCGTRADVRELNRLAQAERLQAGVLRGEGVSLNGDRFYEGDRILVTKNDYELGVRNGDLGTVTAVKDGKNLVVRFDETKRTVSIPVGTECLLSYCITTHRSQGATVENAYVLAGGRLTSSELTYVQASRAALNCHWFADQPTLELAEEMSRPRRNELAHELAQEVLLSQRQAL